jgi:hypothetical protein
VATQRRNSRTITNVPIQQPTQNIPTNTNDQNGGNNHHKLFAFESFDDSIRRFQRLREIRKNLRTKYDDPSQQVSISYFKSCLFLHNYLAIGRINTSIITEWY